MKIPAWLYFCCWALTSITFLVLGLRALHQHEISVPPLVIFVFKTFLTFSVCHSSSYALIYILGTSTERAAHLGSLFVWFRVIPYHIDLGAYRLWGLAGVGGFVTAIMLCCTDLIPGFSFSLDLFVRITILWFWGEEDFFSTWFVLLASLATAKMAKEEGPPSDGSVQVPRAGNKKRNIGRFALAMLGSILLQHYVKFTAFSHVLAFLYCIAAWLGCTALVMSSEDFGVFDFLLTNVLVGCTVNEFGVRGQTWFAYCASIMLFGLRWGLGTVQLDPKEKMVLIWEPQLTESHQAELPR